MTAMIDCLEVRPVSGCGNLRAYASARLGCIEVFDLRIIQQPGQSPYVALPQRPTRPKADGTGSGWRPCMRITNPKVLDQLRAVVLESWQQSLRTGEVIPPPRTTVHRNERPRDPRQERIDELHWQP